MSFGILIASSIIMFAIFLNYIKEKHMSVMSTKLFFIFMVFATLNIIFEWATRYTLKYCDWDSFLNRFSHILFIASLISCAFFLFLYVDIKSRVQQRYSLLSFFIRVIPYTLSILAILFVPVDYEIGKNGIMYSKGPMIYIAYLAVFIYIAFIIFLVIRRKAFEIGERISIYCGTLSLIIIEIIQFSIPELLLSSVGIVLITLFLTLSVENTHDYLDFEIKTALNVFAFNEMISELYEKKKKFYVISYIANSTYHDDVIKILNNINNEYLKYPTYISHEGVLSVFFTKKEIYDLNIEVIKNKLKKNSNVNYFISVIECPAYAINKNEFNDYIEFIKHSFEPKEVLNFYNENDILKKNYNLTVERILKDALKNDGFSINYQPIYSTKDKKFDSAEALIRLKDNKTVGYISPEIFIPIAERIGIINDITAFVLDKICKDMHDYNFLDLGIKYIEMNISGIDATDINLPIKFNECLKKYQIKPEQINIEITETASVSSMEKFEFTMNAFRDYGYKFSMDDFGTGYSNLKKLSETPFELIKIDKSLIWPGFDMLNERKDISLNILKECIDLIHSIGSGIVAEGVETKEMLDYLEINNVEHIQGYYFSKPLDILNFVEFIKKNNK